MEAEAAALSSVVVRGRGTSALPRTAAGLAGAAIAGWLNTRPISSTESAMANDAAARDAGGVKPPRRIPPNGCDWQVFRGPRAPSELPGSIILVIVRGRLGVAATLGWCRKPHAGQRSAFRTRR